MSEKAVNAILEVNRMRRERAEREREELIDQLQSLLETLESGDVETACIWLRAAIKRLEG